MGLQFESSHPSYNRFMQENSQLEINHPAPGFTLPDMGGQLHSLSNFRGKIVIINFWSAECPWSHRVDQALVEQVHKWGDRVVLLPVASNSNEDTELIIQESSTRGLPLVLHDENHVIADLYRAITTPHFFVVDQQGILRYQGAYDDVTFRQREPTQDYLIDAVEALLQGEQPEPSQTDSYGCSLVRQLP
jgi:peroxiredoxin